MEIDFPIDDENVKEKIANEVMYVELWLVIFNWNLELDRYGI
jgi:hypothetical protein